MSQYHVFLPGAASADDAAVVARVTSIIVAAYAQGEQGIWTETYERTHPAEVEDQLRQGRLILASTSASSPCSPATNVVGCMRLGRLADSTAKAEFGSFGIDPSAQNTGLGKRLVEYGEDLARQWGCTTMVLELLVPTTFDHPFKARLNAWYQRMGYKIISTRDFALDYPQFVPLLATHIDYVVYEKEL